VFFLFFLGSSHPFVLVDAAKLVFGAVNDGLSMEGAAQKLVETAFKKQSMDNLSVLIIDLRRDEMNNFL
jgi:serine/threonine protein phosphatase PrpC